MSGTISNAGGLPGPGRTIDNVVDSTSHVPFTAVDLQSFNRARINEFGEIILNIPSIFDRGITFPVGGASLESAAAELDTMISLDVLKRIKYIIAEVMQMNVGNKYTDDVSLAARGFRHDTNTDLNFITLGVNKMVSLYEKVRTLEENPAMANVVTFVNALCSDLENFRLLALSSNVYLASGGTDSRCLTYVDASQLGYLMGRRRGSEFGLIRMRSQSNQHGLVPSTVYAAAHQIAKNAKTDYTVKYNERKVVSSRYGALIIKDRGQGLLTEDKTGPLPADRFHEIFYDFSTKEGGGLGLQVAMRLMDLSNGWIEVTSRAKDGKVYTYSTPADGTPTGKLECLGRLPHYRGAEFKLYFPKVAG